ncbi:MAG: PspC domain-containing protein [Rhodanobacteraceae bacterium]|nr:PspC domain-containing protein [Rhodanobacteraceae bacterium]
MNERFSPGARLYRDIDRRWLAGVLAGAASHFGWNLTALRIVTIVACMTPIVPVIVVGYVLAALILPPRTQLPPPPPAAEQWQSAPPPGVTASELKYRLREMEDRLRAMEAYVTSAQYEIDRELKRGPN